MKPHISVLGIDLAKRVFHVVGMDERGQIILRKRLSRNTLRPFIGTRGANGYSSMRSGIGSY
jgi:hypothetical protein